MRSLLIVGLLASTAHADVAAMVGAGASRIDSGNGTSLLPALDAYVGGKLDEHWSIGGRFQAAFPVHASQVDYVGGGDDSEVEDFSIRGVDLGVAARYEDKGWWVSPWIGAHVASVKDHDYGQAVGDPFDTTSTDFSAALELGLTAAIDVYELESDRVSLYVDYHLAVGASDDSPLKDWSAVTLGLAYCH